MIEERFDVVDEHDRPTGRLTTKKEAHEKGYPHRVAAVLVFRENGKLIAQEHKLVNRLLDHAVGGHVSSGETYKEAAIRETEEELGLRTTLKEVALSVPTKSKDPRPQFRHIIHFYGVYKAIVPTDWAFQETEEVDSLVEMEIEEAVEMMNSRPERFLDGFFISLSAYLRKEKSSLRINAYGLEW